MDSGVTGFDGVCTCCATPSTCSDSISSTQSRDTTYDSDSHYPLPQIPVVWVSQPQGIQTSPQCRRVDHLKDAIWKKSATFANVEYNVTTGPTAQLHHLSGSVHNVWGQQPPLSLGTSPPSQSNFFNVYFVLPWGKHLQNDNATNRLMHETLTGLDSKSYENDVSYCPHHLRHMRKQQTAAQMQHMKANANANKLGRSNGTKQGRRTYNEEQRKDGS
jgi:hypothetical protein